MTLGLGRLFEVGRDREMAKLELVGTITCIHHDWTRSNLVEPGLNLNWMIKGKVNLNAKPEPLPYSIIDVKVGRREMRIIRPIKDRFEFQRQSTDEHIKSGDKVKITIETLPKEKKR